MKTLLAATIILPLTLFNLPAQAAEAMTAGQVLVWFVWPAIVAIVAGGGGIWLSRRI